MKRHIFSVALLLIVGFSSAQQYLPVRSHQAVRPDIIDIKILPSIGRNDENKIAVNDSFTVAHFTGAQDTSGRFMWEFNWNHSQMNKLRWAYVRFDTLHDSQGNPKSYSATQSTLVDSIFIVCGHKKTSPSTVLDSITISLLNLTLGVYTWDTTITTSTSITPSNNWLQSTLLRIPCKHILNPNEKFGVRVGFAGPTQDTFGILVGFNNAGPCGASNVSATRSTIPLNSFRNYAMLDTSFTSTPLYAYNFTYPSDIWRGVFFRDCNGNGSYDSGSNEEEVFQSAYIFCDIILSGINISITEGSLTSALNVYPNPSNGVFNVSMDLGSAVDMNISVTDLQGKVVYTESISNASNLNTTLNLAHLNKGVYIFRAATATGSAIQKIVIN